MVQLVVGFTGEEFGGMVLRQKKLLTCSYSAVLMVTVSYTHLTLPTICSV